MRLQRPLATLFGAIALLFAIVGALVVLESTGTPPPPAGTAPRAGTARPRDRVRARPAPRPERTTTPTSEVPADAAPAVERLPAPAGTGFVVGTVTDAVTGEPVRGTTIRLLHPTGEPISSETTDHAGRYTIDGVPTDVPLVLQVLRKGYLSGLCCDVTARDAQLLRKDIALRRAPRVLVRLVAMPWQRAAANEPVRITDGDREVASGTTDEDGRVELRVPELGRFLLRIGGGELAPRPAEDLVLLPGGGDVEIERQVRRGGSVVVTVVDEEGAPVPDTLLAAHATGLDVTSGAADADGGWQAGPYPPDIDVRVTAATEDGTRRGAAVASIRDGYDAPVLVTLRSTVRVAGRVLVARPDATEPVAGARVELWLPESGTLLAVAEADREGAFEVPDLPDARLVAVVKAPGFVETRVGIDGADTEAEIALSPAPSGTIDGRIIDEHDAAVEGALVSVVPGDVSARTDELGRFELNGVPADDELRVLVTAAGMRMSDAYARDGLTVLLRSGQRRRVVIQMEKVEPQPVAARDAAILRVSGRVVQRSAAPVAAARVLWAGLEAVTGEDGAFDLARSPGARGPVSPHLQLVPPAGLLEPLRLPLLEPDEEGAVDVGAVALRTRPATLLRLDDAPGAGGPARQVALVLDTTDTLLGIVTRPFAARTAVTYDGAWLHVAPPGAWQRGGHRRAWAGVLTEVAPVVAVARWPCSADALHDVAPEWRDALGRSVRLKVPKAYRGGRLELRLVRPSGGIPYERLGLPSETSLPVERTTLRLAPFPAGAWQGVIRPPESSSLPTLHTVIRDGLASPLRPAR